tara:strand:+ start:7411 stop:7989 length:579 start_codon:yes stop_codon:yes gene_type:complete
MSPDTRSKILSNIREEEGLELTPYQREGEEFYTVGYGRYGKMVDPDKTITKEQAEQFLNNDVDVRLAEIQKLIPDFSNMPEDLQINLFSEYYRGSVRQSPNTVSLINSGRYAEAADEFLNNDEYKKVRGIRDSGGKDSGVIGRMEAVSSSLRDYQASIDNPRTISSVDYNMIRSMEEIAADRQLIGKRLKQV